MIYRESLHDELVKFGKKPAAFSTEEVESVAFLGDLFQPVKSQTEVQIVIPQDTASIQVHAMTMLDKDALRAAEAFHRIVLTTTKTRESIAKRSAEVAGKYRRWEFETNDGRSLIGLDEFNAKVTELAKLDMGEDYRPEFEALILRTVDDLVAFAATVTSLGCLALLRISVCKTKDFLSASYIAKSEIGIGFNGSNADDILKQVRWAAEAGKLTDEAGHFLYSVSGIRTRIQEGYRYALCSYAKASSLNQALARLARKGVFSFEDRTLEAALSRKA